jgi:hypothetical protein
MVLPSLTRRAFMKGIGALAGSKILPKGLTKILPNVQKELPLNDAVPWVKNMVHMAKASVAQRAPLKLPNGTEISYLKKPLNEYDSHKLAIKTADGNEDLINFKEGKKDITIEFDVADDFHTNQYLEIDKKTGYTEMIDSNLRMAPGGEDIIKDDPIVWAMEKTDVRDRMILDATTKPDDYMYDYMSIPDDTDYGYLFERYVDSFSPSGSIFNTKKIADAERARETLMKEISEMNWEEQFRRGSLHGFSKGGIMKDVVPPLDGYAAGGVGKKIIQEVAPKVINKLREFAPQITGKVSQPKKPFWTVLDEDGLPIKDFNNEKLARDFIRNNEYADMYTIGKSTDQAAPTDAPAMFFRSREEIIQGPPIMTGEQWMKFLKARGIRDAELMDTSMGPWLNQNLKNKVSKNDLVNKFDESVPEFNVQVLGEETTLNVDRLKNSLQNLDTTVFPKESGSILRVMQDELRGLDSEKAKTEFLKRLDNLFDAGYGIPNVSKTGIPIDNTSVPYEVRQLMGEVLSGTGRRGVGFKKGAYTGRSQYGGQQTLDGGQNHREFLFSYKPKGPRKNEPVYNYAHSFGGADTKNAFMHARVSDRVDEYGNKLLFVEEFQSDMHQPISRAIREATKKGKDIPKEGRYAARLDVEQPKLNKSNLQQMELIQRQIDRLLETKPNSPKLAKLYEQKEVIRNMEKDAAKKLSKETTGIPEGPFKNSQDYMEFAIKYLLRVAKDGNYDGIAFSTPAVKNRNLSRGSKDYQGNLVAYGDILKKALAKAKSKSGADLIQTSIKGDKISGGSFGGRNEWNYYGVPVLMLKGNTKALEKISKGLPAYSKGGKGPQPYGIMKDVIQPL